MDRGDLTGYSPWYLRHDWSDWAHRRWRSTMAAQADKGHTRTLCPWCANCPGEGQDLAYYHQVWMEGTRFIFPNEWWQAWRHLSHLCAQRQVPHTVWQGCISVVWTLSWSHKELALGSFSVYDWMVKMKMMEVFPFITTRLAALCSPFVHFLGILPQPLSHCLPHFPLRQHVLSSWTLPPLLEDFFTPQWNHHDRHVVCTGRVSSFPWCHQGGDVRVKFILSPDRVTSEDRSWCILRLYLLFLGSTLKI